MKKEPECNICGSDIDEEVGDVIGYFGISPVSFCVWCISSMTDMVIQMQGLDDLETLKEKVRELEKERKKSEN